MEKTWMAKWIGFNGCTDATAPVFRNSLFVEDVPESSSVDISGLGAYVLRINGRRVGEDILQPAFSEYGKTVYYNTYDLAEYLSKGENSIEVTLGNVWYNEQQATDWHFEVASWKGTPRFIAEFCINENIMLISDETWDCAESKTVFNSLRCGEHYDATKEVVYTSKASVLPSPAGELRKQTIHPIRVSRIYEPQRIIKCGSYVGVDNKKFIYDFGINLSGNVEITGTGKRGDTITIQYFERLMENMRPDLKSLSGGVIDDKERNMFQCDKYIFAGEGTEKWNSEFGYNGFRYVMIVGDFDTLDIKARCFYTQINTAGDIECDSEQIMKIHNAVKQSTLTNFHHMPTDCPHREKNGWTADAHLSAEQALFNFDMIHAYDKWMQDFVDSQEPSGILPRIIPYGRRLCDIWPCWEGAVFIIPWQLYRYTGDIYHLEKSYDCMHGYLKYLDGFIMDGLCSEGICDWLALLDVGDPVPKEALITMFCGYIAKIFQKIALILNEEADARYAELLHNKIRCAFIKKYGNLKADNQTFYAMQLMFDFSDDRDETLEKLAAAVESADCHITGGIFCSKYLLDALTENGRFDLAYKVASQKDFPGWEHLVNVNSGTLGEDWFGGLSGNHHMFSEIGAWYYKALAGFKIDDDAPGFKHVVIEPHIPQDIKNFKAYHITPYGKLLISWDESKITVEVPEDATASFIYNDYRQELSGGEYTFLRK